MTGGGGGGTNYSEVEQTTSNLPEYAEPYYKDLLARTGFETAQPYETYGGQRLAYFSPAEQEAMARMNELGVSGTPGELSQAAGYAQQVGGSNPAAGITGVNAQGYQAASPGQQGDYYAGSRDSGYNPNAYSSGYQANQIVGSFTPDNYEFGYDPDQYSSNYQAGQREMGFEPGTLADNEMLQEYMDPYMQSVVDIEKREANRQADTRHAATGLDAAGMGSLGGYREAIMRSEAERNLAQQTGDIQTRGSQQAFQNAQQAFEQDRAARAQAEQFGQSQFGMNQGLSQEQERLAQSGFGMNQQAQQAAEQLGQAGFGLNQQGKMYAADLMMQGFNANEAARQAQEQFGQSAFGMSEQAQQMAEQYRQSQFGMNEQNQQFQAQQELAVYDAYEQARQEAGRQGLSAAEIEQAGQIAMAQARLQGDQNRLAASGQLADISGQQQLMELERLRAMQGSGMQQRGLMQQGLDMGYQDFLRQQSYPREQLAFYSNMLQGASIAPGQTVSTYGPQPSTGQQLLGAGLGGLGLYGAYNQGGYGGGG